MLLHDLIPLPRLLLNRSSRGNYHICTYKNAWDKEKRRSKRIACNSIGTILGGGKEGPIKWNKKFLAKYPVLENLACYRRGRDIEYIYRTQEKEEVVTSISDLFDNFDRNIEFQKTYNNALKGSSVNSGMLIINGNNSNPDFDTLATIQSESSYKRRKTKIKKPKGPRLPKELQKAKEDIVRAVEEGISFEDINFEESTDEIISITAHAKRVAREIHKEAEKAKEIASTQRKRGRKPKNVVVTVEVPDNTKKVTRKRTTKKKTS